MLFKEIAGIVEVTGILKITAPVVKERVEARLRAKVRHLHHHLRVRARIRADMEPPREAARARVKGHVGHAEDRIWLGIALRIKAKVQAKAMVPKEVDMAREGSGLFTAWRSSTRRLRTWR